MHISAFASLLIASVLFTTLAHATPGKSYGQVAVREEPASLQVRTLDMKRDGHDYHGVHHAEPLLQLNESEILMDHAPTPESYYTIDLEGADPSGATRHPGLMFAHAALMSLAFFAFLPIGKIFPSI